MIQVRKKGESPNPTVTTPRSPPSFSAYPTLASVVVIVEAVLNHADGWNRSTPLTIAKNIARVNA
jgi:hypothetical protein